MVIYIKNKLEDESMFKLDKIIKYIEKSVVFFLASQVPIDLLTTFSVKILDIPISFGMITRMIIIILWYIYIFFAGNRMSKIMLSLLSIIVVYQLMYVLNAPHIDIFANTRYYFRVIYYAVALIFFANYIKNSNKETILKVINFNVFVIGMIFLISYFTKSFLPMYTGERVGSSAWFLSGNEISSIMSVLAFIPIYCFLKKRTIFNYIIILLQVFVLIALGTKSSLLALSLVCIYALVALTLLFMEKKINIKYVFIWITVLIGIGFFFDKLPAIYNIKYQRKLQLMINLKQSYSDESEIPQEIVNNRYKNFGPIDLNEYISKINISTLVDDNYDVFIYVDGYFYPLYFDASHPKYIEKTLIFSSPEHTLEVPLTDEYNRFVSEMIDQDYNPDFSGLSAIVNVKKFVLNSQYKMHMKINVDGILKIYDLSFDDVCVNLNGQIISFNYDKRGFEIKKVNDDINKLKDSNNYCNNNVKYNILLSNRLKDVDEFINCTRHFKTYNLFLGSGYVGNLISDNGFEMEFIELFITFGLLGFSIYFMMTINIVFNIIRNIVRLKKVMVIFKQDILCFATTVLLSFLLSFFVGHMILTPSSSIYLAIILTILNLNIGDEISEK